VIVSADTLTAFQQCKRRWALEREYRYTRWRPRKLLELLLRDAIFKLSNGGDPVLLAQDACTKFLEQAASPGLDIVTDPYTLSRDFCAIIQTTLEAVSRLTLLTLKKAEPVMVGEHRWQTDAFIDESGILHRWVCVERWDADTQYQHVHSWQVFGECAANAVGMSLHVIEIGKSARGHQHTAWARAFKHPIIAGKYRFRKVDGSALEPSWKPVWYQDSASNDPKVWVDLMEADGLQLIQHVNINEPETRHVEQFMREVEVEAARMTGDWESAPMSRSACDMPYTCAWQPVCYGDGNVEAAGGFIKIR
jgi:hypothetical protein